MGDCIIWPKSVGSHGYGQQSWWAAGRSHTTTAHRWAWEQANGPIPPGMTVDHICRNRRCVNVNHLRLLTNAENARDNGNARKTHCPRGHAYDGTNTYVDPEGHRRCRECARARRAS